MSKFSSRKFYPADVYVELKSRGSEVSRCVKKPPVLRRGNIHEPRNVNVQTIAESHVGLSKCVDMHYNHRSMMEYILITI